MDTINIPLARYQFRFTITQAFRQSEYAGSMLRGAFGHALKRVCCITREKDCTHCMMYRSCAYPAIFSTPPKEHSLQQFTQIPNPYIIEPPRWGRQEYQPGDHFVFHMVLTGQALKHLSLIILSWQRAFRQGLGTMRGRGELLDVSIVSDSGSQIVIYNRVTEQIREHNTHIRISTKMPDGHNNFHEIKLRIQTPMRIQKHSKPLREKNINARDLLVTLARRVNLISQFHNDHILIEDFKRLSQQAENIQLHHTLKWRDWTRYSSRQHQKMILGGVMGELVLQGDLQPFSQMLQIGQWLHLGKNATFGMGKYQLFN